MAQAIKQAKIDNFIDTKYSKIENKTKAILIVGSLVVPAVLCFFFLFKPQMEKMNTLEKQVNVAKEELNKARKAALDLPKYQKDFDNTQKIFDDMAVLLPKSQEIPNLLRSISDLGKTAGLDFLTFTPGQEAPKDFYAEIPIEITIKGPYHNMGSFLDKVSKLERIVTVNNITMDKPEQDKAEMLLNSSCRLLTYRFTNVKLEPPKDGKAKDGKAKDGKAKDGKAKDGKAKDGKAK